MDHVTHFGLDVHKATIAVAIVRLGQSCRTSDHRENAEVLPVAGIEAIDLQGLQPVRPVTQYLIWTAIYPG